MNRSSTSSSDVQTPERTRPLDEVRPSSVSAFLEQHFRHFNARELLAAAKSYRDFVGSSQGGQMLVSLAGAMSTGELGRSLAAMIRADKVHAISCTAANLEEDLFNLFAHNDYKIVSDWRALSVDDELELRDAGMNRVTDTCIPETVMRHLESRLLKLWQTAAQSNSRFTPADYMHQLLDDSELMQHCQADPEHSWLVAAKEKEIPIFVPGFEDSTLGNVMAARVYEGVLSTHSVVCSGTEQMSHLIDWYTRASKSGPLGFFQIGGGIAGDFAICVVPLLIQDLKKDVPLWQYFCQIGDAVTSYGGYSGAVPNEKITWYKLGKNSPKFMIQSDATICAPLIFAYVMEW